MCWCDCVTRISACAVVLFGAYAIHIRYQPFLEHSATAEAANIQAFSATFGSESVITEYVGDIHPIGIVYRQSPEDVAATKVSLVALIN